MQEHNTINEYQSQVQHITKNLAIKKNYNNKIIDWLQKNGESERAEKIANCGQHVGIAASGCAIFVHGADNQNFWRRCSR